MLGVISAESRFSFAEEFPPVEQSPVTAVPRTPSKMKVLAFICTNCLHPAGQARADAPAIPWPCEVQEILVPCSGRLQPEHLLKAFENGADLVCVVACEKDNCSFVEGSRRAGIRGAFVSGLLDEIGIGGERLMLVYLPGSAHDELWGKNNNLPEDLPRRLAAISAEIATRLKNLKPNPMGKTPEHEEEAEFSDSEEENED
jgi:coenzyme F420-reducing hydrogenase delta subunit